MVELFANSGDPDQMPHYVASDLGLHCLPVTLVGEHGLKQFVTMICISQTNEVIFRSNIALINYNIYNH